MRCILNTSKEVCVKSVTTIKSSYWILTQLFNDRLQKCKDSQFIDAYRTWHFIYERRQKPLSCFVWCKNDLGYDNLTFDLHDVEEECNAKLVLSWEINETTNELSRTNLTWQCIFNPFKRSIWQFLINLMVFIIFHNCTIPLQWLKKLYHCQASTKWEIRKEKVLSCRL